MEKLENILEKLRSKVEVNSKEEVLRQGRVAKNEFLKLRRMLESLVDYYSDQNQSEKFNNTVEVYYKVREIHYDFDELDDLINSI